MKNFKLTMTCFFVLSLLLTSCSKDETATSNSDFQDTFQIQFGTLLNDFSNQNKSHLSDDPVVCRDLDPSYVLVALTDSEGEWVDGKNPEADGANQDDFIKINIKNNNGSWETEYSDALGLPAGDYYLQYFIVYGTDGEVLWVAPREGGAYAGSVSDPLPQEINLGAGTKPYVEVDVLCYVPRMEEAYGYLFFDINAMAIENNYCLFVNYCDDVTGREYPAKFSVDVWGDDYDGTEVIIDGAMNSVSGSGNSFAATVLCMALPPLAGDAVYYVRVTVLSAGAYTADASDIKEFTISQADVAAQLLATPKYEHLRINCGDDGGNGENDCTSANGDCDGDGILNKCDDDDAGNVNYDSFDCDGDSVLNGADTCADVIPGDGQTDPDGDGCWTTPDGGGDVCTLTESCSIGDVAEGIPCYNAFLNGDDTNFVRVESADDIIQLKDIEDKVNPGSVSTSINNGQLKVSISSGIDDISKYEIEVRPADGGDISTTCNDSKCSTSSSGTSVDVSTFSKTAVSAYPFYLRVKTEMCAGF